jgi:hypothetical protein
MHKLYAWCEYICARGSAKERLLLIASVQREDISNPITPKYATLMLLRCLGRDSLQGVIQLCQK